MPAAVIAAPDFTSTQSLPFAVCNLGVIVPTRVTPDTANLIIPFSAPPAEFGNSTVTGRFVAAPETYTLANPTLFADQPFICLFSFIYIHGRGPEGPHPINY